MISLPKMELRRAYRDLWRWDLWMRRRQLSENPDKQMMLLDAGPPIAAGLGRPR